MLNGCIWLVDRNVRGAIVIYGAIGVRQYYCYGKKEAIRRYKEECERLLMVER